MQIVEKLNPDAATTSYLHALEIMVARGFRHIPIAKSRQLFGSGRIAVYGMLDIVVCTRQLTRHIVVPAPSPAAATPAATPAGPPAAAAGAGEARQERASSLSTESLPDSFDGTSAATALGGGAASGAAAALTAAEATVPIDGANVVRLEGQAFTLVRNAHRKLHRDVQAAVGTGAFEAVVETCASALSVLSQVLATSRGDFAAAAGIAAGVKLAALLSLAMRIHLAKALGAAQLAAAAADGGGFMQNGERLG
jgi:hypothetical protein